MDEPRELGKVGLFGYGAWGPNLAKAFLKQGLDVMVYDVDECVNWRAREIGCTIADTISELMNNTSMVAIATPAYSHFELAHRALRNGKHVLVEKPFTLEYEQTLQLLDMASVRGRIVAVDHTYLFHPAIAMLRGFLIDGKFGHVYSYNSVRTNTEVGPHNVNVVDDMGPHDFSVFAYLFGRPHSFKVHGVPHVGEKFIREAHVDMLYGTDPLGWLRAHIHLNWRSPLKTREIRIVGTDGMAVFDELRAEQLRLFDTKGQCTAGYTFESDHTPLEAMVEHFVGCVRTGMPPLNGANEILDVAKMLKAARDSSDYVVTDASAKQPSICRA